MQDRIKIVTKNILKGGSETIKRVFKQYLCVQKKGLIFTF